MNTNQRFAVSVHILTLLATCQDDTVTSETIATSVDTHPVVIRRTMAHLRAHGLVDSRAGASGGWRLLKSPGQISLSQVYHAASHENVLTMHRHPDPDCQIGGNIHAALRPVFDQAQNAMEAALDQFTIADVLQNVMLQVEKRPQL